MQFTNFRKPIILKRCEEPRSFGLLWMLMMNQSEHSTEVRRVPPAVPCRPRRADAAMGPHE